MSNFIFVVTFFTQPYLLIPQFIGLILGMVIGKRYFNKNNKYKIIEKN